MLKISFNGKFKCKIKIREKKFTNVRKSSLEARAAHQTQRNRAHWVRNKIQPNRAHWVKTASRGLYTASRPRRDFVLQGEQIIFMKLGGYQERRAHACLVMAGKNPWVTYVTSVLFER